MSVVVGIPVAGEMGAGIGARLVSAGARVRTITAGRSSATRDRAAAAGMESVEETDLCAADIVLSITPPGVALETARKLAPALSGAQNGPVYVDCNAISPETASRVGEVIVAAGARFADGGIIGMPPVSGKPGPVIYVSGEAAGEVGTLTDFGLDIRPIEGGVGAASALKMCYGGLTKGILGLGAALILAAERAGIADVLHDELQASQQSLLGRFERMLPDAYPKAYRWVAEMEQISSFLESDRAESEIYRGLAGLYERLAADHDGEGVEIEALERFLRHSRA